MTILETLLGFKDASTLRQVFGKQARRYTYSTPLATVAALTSVQATASVEAATDFVVEEITARAYYSSGINIHRLVDFFVDPMPRIDIIDQASGAALFDRSDTIFTNVWGDARDPYRLATPHLFRAQSVITAIINNVASVGMLVMVAFHGHKRPTRG